MTTTSKLPQLEKTVAFLIAHGRRYTLPDKGPFKRQAIRLGKLKLVQSYVEWSDFLYIGKRYIHTNIRSRFSPSYSDWLDLQEVIMDLERKLQAA